MKIIVTGNFEIDYNRTVIILQGLEQIKGVELTVMPYRSNKDIKRLDIAAQCDHADFVFLPSFSHADVKKIKRITKTPIVFDPLISKYLAKVFDYKTVSRYSPRALKNFLKDKRSMSAADIVLADTEAHKNYFVNKIGIPAHKIKVLYIGVNCDEFCPEKTSTPVHDKFCVGFYGAFAPLQGVDNIVETAYLLQDEPIVFDIVGTGFDMKKVQRLVNKYKLTNWNFLGQVSYNALSSAINKFDICLGIFGGKLQTQLVVPNKAYHYAACKKAIISERTPAIIEVFEDQKDILLSSADPQDIAQKILTLKNDVLLRERIAQNAYTKMKEHYQTTDVAQQLVGILQAYQVDNRQH